MNGVEDSPKLDAANVRAPSIVAHSVYSISDATEDVGTGPLNLDISTCSLLCASNESPINEDKLALSAVTRLQSSTIRQSLVYRDDTLIPTTVSVYVNCAKSAVAPKRILFVIVHELDNVLNTYQYELDAFCRIITDRIGEKCDEISPDLATYMSGWHRHCVEYIDRVVSFLSPSLPDLLFALMIGRRLQRDEGQSDVSVLPAQGGLSELTEDVYKLAEYCCGIQTDEEGTEGETNKMQPILIIQNNDKYSVNCNEETEFTAEWALKLRRAAQTSGSQSHTLLKEIMLDYKHRAYGHLNAFTRKLGAATIDHYTLFRTLEFLRSSRNGLLLLHWAGQQQRALSSDEQRLLRVLQHHLVPPL